MNSGLVSIIMPAYNAEKYIALAIESVIRQTYEKWELIIVNDCSLDSTKEIVKSYADLDTRIKIISLSRNQGVAKARNLAMNSSNGEYIAFLDSDDIWNEDKLYKQIEYINKQNSDLCYSAYSIVDENGILVKRRSVVKGISYEDLLEENIIILSTVLIKKSCIRNIVFNPNCYHEDYCFWLELIKSGVVFVGLDENLLCYRVHSSGRSFNKINAAKHRWLIYRNILKMGIIESLYYFIQYAFNGVRKYF